MFLPNIKSKEELVDLTELLYRICKHSLALPCHNKETEDVVFKNMRMGIGMTGIMQATEEQMSWLDEVYLRLRDFDVHYSEDHGFNPSIKLTTVKPSGTLSLLPGVVPGVHPGYARFMYRRITIATDNPLVAVCRKHGYPVEYKKNLDGTDDYGSVVVTFPFSYPDGTVLAKDTTALSQLEWVRKMQEIWSDNSVSCTVYYRKEELPGIIEYLKKYYRNNHKSLSFLLHSNHGFAQAPYEEVTEKEYLTLLNSTTQIRHVDTAEFEGADECPSGVCPVK